ncbi:MAG: hypothetical protein IKI28_03645 [Bacteroidales bacterium]|nr:hypothetical protein [Bacteroidales bacterium]
MKKLKTIVIVALALMATTLFVICPVLDKVFGINIIPAIAYGLGYTARIVVRLFTCPPAIVAEISFVLALPAALLWLRKRSSSEPYRGFRPLPWWFKLVGLVLLLIPIVPAIAKITTLRSSFYLCGLLLVALSRNRQGEQISLPIPIALASTLLVAVGYHLITQSEVKNILGFMGAILVVHIGCRCVLNTVNQRNQLNTNNITTKADRAADKGACPLA